jgi:hypothetical protein
VAVFLLLRIIRRSVGVSRDILEFSRNASLTNRTFASKQDVKLDHINKKPRRHKKFDGRCGVEVEILAYYASGREFDSRTVQTFVYINMSVCIGSGCFYA